jgi:hypothetical protein
MKVKFLVAFTNNHNPQFAIIPITKEAWDDDDRLPAITKKFQRYLNGTQVVLMYTNAKGLRSFYGTKDLTDYLRNRNMSHLIWERREEKGFWEEYFEIVGNNLVKALFGIAVKDLGGPGPPPGF